MEITTGNPIIDEAINLSEALTAKTNIYGPFANFKMMICPGENPGQTFLVFTIEDTVMYKVPMRNNAVKYFGSGSGVHKEGLDIFDPNILNELSAKYKFYSDFISTNLPLAQDDELRNNEDFEKLLGLRADDGLKFYNLPDYDHPGESYLIPMFAGFLSLNKSDTVGVKIYDLDQRNHLIKFNIYKKKLSREIEMYCRVLKI